MPLADDGDEIRAIGFVAIYFADLEGLVDDWLEACDGLINVSQRFLDGATFSRKIDRLRTKVLPLFQAADYRTAKEDMEVFAHALDNCIWCAHERNEVLHSPLQSIPSEQRVIRLSKRRGVYDVHSPEIYELANRIWATGGQVHHAKFAVRHYRRGTSL